MSLPAALHGDSALDNILQLLCHPKTPADYVEAIAVTYELSAEGRLWLRYHVEVAEPMIEMPADAEPIRADNLWKTTCFEAFLAIGDEPEYIELNFSPSSQWAAYQFASYRDVRTDLPLLATPEIYLDFSNSHAALEATIILPPQWQQGHFSLGLSAVAEEPGGNKSYWALDHKKDEPDFHDRSCFTLELEAAGTP